MSDEIQAQRTYSQNRALYLWFTQLAEALNDAGLEPRILLKPEYSLRWTKEMVHDNLWIPIQRAMYGTDSTIYLHKIEQIDKIYSVINRELGEKHGLEAIPFPDDPEIAPSADKKYDKI